MRLTKFGHACVRIEHGGIGRRRRPGRVHRPRGASTARTPILITHEHPDHYLPDHLRRTDAAVCTIDAVAAVIREDAPDVAERLTVGHAGAVVRRRASR